MPDETGVLNRFLTDRMLGTLCRYLRFMGYDTLSANSLGAVNHREDSGLLEKSVREKRILLTRDRELASRAGAVGIYVVSENVLEQISQLKDLGLIDAKLRMTRCSLCNTLLRAATETEVAGVDYAPAQKKGFSFFWCNACNKLYWDGTHGKQLSARLKGLKRQAGYKSH